MQNIFSLIITIISVSVSIFCLYKILIIKSDIIRINYISLLILSIFLSISFYNDYLSITVVVTKVKGKYFYYMYNNKEKYAEFDQKIKIKVGDKIILYFKNNDYYLPTKTIYNSHSLLFLLSTVSVFLYFFTKKNYPEEFKNSGL